MLLDSHHKLKMSFRAVFPEYAKALDGAKTQADIDQLHESFIAEARTKLTLAYQAAGITEPADQTASIALTQDTYNILINATGNTILHQLHVLIDGLERLKNMENDEAGIVTVQILLAGVIAIGALSQVTVFSSLLAGAIETTAAFAGVTAATVSAVCAEVGLVIILILIPIIYYMQKPANCIALLINETPNPLVFADDYCVHGKRTLMTTPLSAAITIPNVGVYPVAGLIASQKDSQALIGSQYGFVMNYASTGTTLAFGMECPLTGMYVDNNCYCSFGETAEIAAKKTDSVNKQYFEASMSLSKTEDLRISIRCNSGSGSIAYYIARAYIFTKVTF